MKTISLLCLFLSLAIPAASARADSEYEIQYLYQALERDFQSNPYFNTANVNHERDGRRSRYLDRFSIPANYTNSEPLKADAIARLSPFKMLPYAIFRQAYLKLRAYADRPKSPVKNPDILTVINFDQPIYQRRLYVFDLAAAKVRFNAYVAHGYKSDPAQTGMARSFSDTPKSNKTSLGAYVTARAIEHTRGFTDALAVRGLQRGINGNAEARGILFHENVSLSEANMARPPNQRSYSLTEGCFGLSHEESGRFYGLRDEALSTLIMRTIAGGTFVYAYSAQLHGR